MQDKILRVFMRNNTHMILSDQEIGARMNRAVDAGGLVIRPWSQACQQPASYDLRAGIDLTIPRGATALVPTLEWVELPADIAATLRCRSSYGRKGLVLTGGFVDPGFRGELTLCLINMGSQDIDIRKDERVVQMIFQEVRNGDRMYNGRYQDSRGAVGAKTG